MTAVIPATGLRGTVGSAGAGGGGPSRSATAFPPLRRAPRAAKDRRQMAEFAAGATFADHIIRGVAGRGGMGVVYRALHVPAQARGRAEGDRARGVRRRGVPGALPPRAGGRGGDPAPERDPDPPRRRGGRAAVRHDALRRRRRPRAPRRGADAARAGARRAADRAGRRGAGRRARQRRGAPRRQARERHARGRGRGRARAADRLRADQAPVLRHEGDADRGGDRHLRLHRARAARRARRRRPHRRLRARLRALPDAHGPRAVPARRARGQALRPLRGAAARRSPRSSPRRPRASTP